MKISLECKDLIIEKTLELFLKDHLVMKKDCDFIISDTKIRTDKPLFIICKNSPFLTIPFSKESLFHSLHEFDNALKATALKLALEQKKLLEEKIDSIACQFKKDYENKIDLAIKDLKNQLIKALTDG
ncbi:ornithine carbamoyltransferase [Campylobacter sp. VicNov18]|uniref:ornithine carbamoyltransferase n=1 Tax=Campylobacter bilis TaxID=2691918 RepID=UPI00130DA993|nr:ornithine carbamoyltransferase [Campylobacter bilis]MPV63975.1 ornithine carbamoyltransferase [Campylobacter hepaticus]MBM0637476.1 ornithine carbamoyltransferase [Campylobacter bilis]MCC8278195.1 ornithine carbamoyltransferase [Campylobacter bilis]MCC8299699.1 ornithine carbamoyltransferase [Campylobacter bilis]MCC8301104.1 ornithine carbamoyltransferase [Campylobacter bilis]